MNTAASTWCGGDTERLDQAKFLLMKHELTAACVVTYVILVFPEWAIYDNKAADVVLAEQANK